MNINVLLTLYNNPSYIVEFLTLYWLSRFSGKKKNELNNCHDLGQSIVVKPLKFLSKMRNIHVFILGNSEDRKKKKNLGIDMTLHQPFALCYLYAGARGLGINPYLDNSSVLRARKI